VKGVELKDSYQGSKYTVTHCKGALKSFEKALQSVEARKRAKFIRLIELQIQRLADGEPMSKDNFPPEGDLPKKTGQHHTNKFHALKRIPIRGYCWLSEKVGNTYYISHYINKDQDGLDTNDTTKVGNNWKKIELD